MNILYKLLFDVNIGHDYYNDGRCPDFEFFPTEDTQRIMRNYSLVAKPTSTGFKVYCKLNSTLSTSTEFITAQRFDEPFRLAFGMRLKNTQFPNFTDLPAKIAPRQVFYLNNRVNVSGSNSSNLLLGETQSAGGHISANDLVFITGDNYHWSFSTALVPDTNVQITWDNFFDNNNRQELFKTDNQGTVHALFKKLFEIPDGFYQISTMPNVIAGNRSVFKCASLAEKPPFGIIEIWSHQTVSENSFREDVTRVVDGQNVSVTLITSKSFVVRFQRRSLPWRYQLVRNNPTLNLANWSVQYSGLQGPYPANVVFTGSPADASSTRREFVSNLPLPFFQTPKSNIQLSAVGLQPMNNLPNPDPLHIKKDNSGNLYAESIIYI